MTKTVVIDVNADYGEVTISSGALFLGEKAPIEFIGYTPKEGNTLRLTVFNRTTPRDDTIDSDVYVVADNSLYEGELDLRYEALRKEFSDKCAHAFPVQVTEYEGRTCLPQVIAVGKLLINYSDIVYDALTGNPVSMKGEQGDKGDKGDKGDDGLSAYQVAVNQGYRGTIDEWLASLKGSPASTTFLPKVDDEGNTTDKWHKVYVQADAHGKMRVVVDAEEASGDIEDHNTYVRREGNVTITGKKTFTEQIAGKIDRAERADVADKAKNADSATSASLATEAVKDSQGNVIVDTYLPLKGDTMSGNIRFSKDVYIDKTDDAGYIALAGGSSGWDSGGVIVARGKNSAEGTKGEVILRAYDGSKESELKLKPEGTLSLDGSQAFLPAGAVFAFAGNVAPAGCLVCNGQEVSRTKYARLFAAIGTIYGGGNGSSTFNLPNLNARFIQGGTSSGEVKAAGLPNITGTFSGMLGTGANAGPWDGAISMGAGYTAGHGGGNNRAFVSANFDASKSNAIYGSSETVQPPAVVLMYCIKY